MTRGAMTIRKLAHRRRVGFTNRLRVRATRMKTTTGRWRERRGNVAGQTTRRTRARGIRHRRGQRERVRVRMRRSRKHIRRVPFFDDRTQVHHHHAIRHQTRDAQIVCDEQVREFFLRLQFLHQFQNLRAHRHIERGHWFVGDNEFRLRSERARQANALPLSAGKLMRKAQRKIFRVESDAFEQLFRTRPRLFAR